MKTISLLFIFLSTILQANMGALLIIPRDSNVMMGIYSGASYASTTTNITSTNPTIDRQSFQYDNYVALIGAIVGLENDYKNIKQDNGLLALRAGTEYIMDKSNSLEIFLEYSYSITNSTGKSFYEGSDFSTYNITDQSSIILHVGYNFVYND